MGYLYTSWGAGLTGYASTLGGEYSFFSNGIWCEGVDVTGISLYIVWGVGADGMELFQPQMKKITSGYQNYPLTGLNFWYMYFSQKKSSE